MINLLILGLFLISIIIYLLLKDNLKEGVLSLDAVPGDELNKFEKDRCEWKRGIQTKLTTTTCALDDRCDHIRLGKERNIKFDKDGRINVVEENKIKCEGFSNKTETESQLMKCDNIKSCEDRGKNCGYCDDNSGEKGLGRFMWTTRGKDGSGMETLTGVANKERPCPKNKWFYGDDSKCIKARRQKLCGLIKSCDDFEKYSDIIDPGMCGFCPSLGKAVPITKIGDRNVPLYQPEDTCSGGPELEKFGTLNAKQCTKFMKQNPCVRPQYWTGLPDHSGECYEKLYSQKKYKVGGKDKKKDKIWWEDDVKRKRFNVDRDSLKSGTTGESRNFLSVPAVVHQLKAKKEKMNELCYSAANNSWEWLTGLKLDPCVHQDKNNVPNKACQSTRWNSVNQTEDGHARRVLNNKINDNCEGFTTIEGYQNNEDWMRKNIPEELDKREAREWYEKKLEESKEKVNIGGLAWKNFLEELETVMKAGKTYQMRAWATLLLKGTGYKPKLPPAIKKGDYVEFKLREHLYRGILWKKKGQDCLVMWDYYKNTSTGSETLRGPSYGVCNKGITDNPGEFNEGACLEGVKGNAYKDNGSTCKTKNGLKKSSCNVPYNITVVSKDKQRALFGYPQYPSVRGKNVSGKLLGDFPHGWISSVFLRVIKKCKSSSKGCSSTDYNCEESLVIANKLYKKPQDCYFSISEFSKCSAKCGGGLKYKEYTILEPAKGKDAKKCPIGENKKNYKEQIMKTKCNTQPCHKDKWRNIKLKWCGKNGDDANCVDSGTMFGATCMGVGSRKRSYLYSGSRAPKETEGDAIQDGSCQDGGKNQKDSAGEILKAGAHFNLIPVKNKPDTYKFKWYPWSSGEGNWRSQPGRSKKAGIKEKYGYHGTCLHPNVNTVEVKDYGIRFGRNQGFIRGPTHGRNYSPPPKTKVKYIRRGHCDKGFVLKYPGGDSNTFANQKKRCANACKDYPGFIIYDSNIHGGRYKGRCHCSKQKSDCRWYSRNKTYVRYDYVSSSNSKKDRWDGLGGLGNCNSKYAELKIEETGNGNFRLKREAFHNLSNIKKEVKKEVKKEPNLINSIINFFIGNKKTQNLKEGYSFSKGSKKYQTPGKGFYMGIPKRGQKSATRDRLYANDTGSIHKFHCDSNKWTAEKRVGIFKCKGGAKNGKKYPFKENHAYCKDKEPLVAMGYRDSDLICKQDCEGNGGKCVGPKKSLLYYVIKANNNGGLGYVHAKNLFWRKQNAKIVLGSSGPGKLLGMRQPWNLMNKARNVPNIYTKMVTVYFHGRDQGWGNVTGWLRLMLWSGNEVIYNKNIGGRACSRGRCLHRLWRLNVQDIPYWEFNGKKPKKITKALLFIEEMGSGHKAFVRNAKIEFNKEAKF